MSSENNCKRTETREFLWSWWICHLTKMSACYYKIVWNTTSTFNNINSYHFHDVTFQRWCWKCSKIVSKRNKSTKRTFQVPHILLHFRRKERNCFDVRPKFSFNLQLLDFLIIELLQKKRVTHKVSYWLKNWNLFNIEETRQWKEMK